VVFVTAAKVTKKQLSGIPWTVLYKTSLKDKFDDLSGVITLVEVALVEVEQGQVDEPDG
jgi:hypothetical protein